MIYLGLDVSKDTVDAQLCVDVRYTHYKITNDAAGWQRLVDVLRALPDQDVHACCEYTGIYYLGLARAIHAAGYTMSVVNAYSVKAFAKLMMARTKTDKKDAQLIALYCEVNRPRAWSPPRGDVVVLKALNRRLHQLNKLRTMEINRLKVAEEICAASHRVMIENIEAQIDEVRAKLNEMIEACEEQRKRQRRLQTIPGIGPVAAAALQSVLVEVGKFPTAKQFVSYLGLSPVITESGKSVRGKVRMSKMGDAYIRASLYMPARSACLRSRAFSGWAKEKMAAGKPAKVVYAAMMRRLATYAYYVIKNDEDFRLEAAGEAGKALG